MTRLTFAINFFSIALSTVLAAPTTAPIIRKSEVIDTIFPHYLVPAVQNFPNTTYATQHTAQINYTGFDSDMSETTMFVGFDVPYNNATNCLIKFTMPDVLSGGYEWTAKGSGKFDVYMVTSLIVPGELSWNNRPQRYPTLNPQPLFRITQPTQGGEAAVDGYMMRCFNGQRMDFELVADHQAGMVEFDWFELDTPKTGITMEMSM
ncbi:hypothetical protein Q9L58_003533 [Maublancomyces gigas]|uniref:Ubiquitin 3 binding protein But2 C-terminal domain-containing protein n=1 Tax=Discina gigas TaxID=1032678 RepID=A0ABR3GNQ4_9PEZI